MRRRDAGHQKEWYVGVCSSLARLAARLGVSRARAKGAPTVKERQLSISIDLAGIDLSPAAVVSASSGAFVLSGLVAAGLSALVMFLTGHQFVVPLLAASTAMPFLARETVLAYPAAAARRRASHVLKGSPESVNLMIMSLRHEPSLPKAIRFAARKENAYARELRRCIWRVVMGAHASFEDALQALGKRWGAYSEELKDSLNALVTASCEATEEGKRRALDRSNNAMVSGTKRRIEEYALSLSGPSMIMFALGILLPLMVGSFLPMLSWNLWTLDRGTQSDIGGTGGGQSILQTVFVMNVLFPAIATLVAMNAVSRHPLDTAGTSDERPSDARAWLLGLAIAAACSGCLAVLILVHGRMTYFLLLIASTAPIAAWLMASGRRDPTDARSCALEDAVFRTGAKMLDGGNFESALDDASRELEGDSGSLVKKLSFATNAAGQDFDRAMAEGGPSTSGSNAFEALRVVRDAASKDELAAGMLAMDLANYLRDLRELETTLKNRLRPTISMMKMTVHVLGPVVLGVTYAIYLALTAMADGPGGNGTAGSFFLVLGLFLAETDVVVNYFVWGIEGGRGTGRLMRSTGACLLVSELVYAATAAMAS